MPGYASDLAFVHDVGFGDFSAKAAPGLVDLLHGRGIHEGLVVDLGCGSGIWAAAATAAGYDVLGIDQSRAMIDLARKRAPEAGFRKASFFNTTLPECDVVTSLGECLGYRFDSRSNFRALGRLFRKVHAALRKDGLFIFDLAGPKRGSVRGRHLHFNEDDWALFLDETRSKDGKTLRREMTTFRRKGHLFSRHREAHELWLYPPRRVLGELRSIGFKVRTRKRYGDLPFPKGLTAYVARKP
jgi:SAM-dependent methyltransferase